MAYSIEYIQEEGGLIVHWHGAVEGKEVIRSYYERYSPLERLQSLRYIITDYSDVTHFNMNPEDVRTIAEIARQAAKHNHNIFGVAAMPAALAYGIARMWQGYASDEETGWRTRVVKTRKEAEDWLLANLDKNLSFRCAQKNTARNL
ncbi:MAG: hypothetical protein JXK94_00310 [Deltaproteobacteria bacterium]|nr:hypothetical protein [Deltaproteobacteria bacterium]